MQMLQMTKNHRWAVAIGAMAGCVLAVLALSAPALASEYGGGPCDCRAQGQCSFNTCCYSGGLCMPDGMQSNGHVCRATKDASGNYSECVAGDACQTSSSCNKAD